MNSKAAIARTEQAVTSLTFKATANDFTEWGSLSGEKTQAMEKAAMDAVLDDVTEGFTKLLTPSGVTKIGQLDVNLAKGYSSIGAGQASSIVSRMRAAGLTDSSSRVIQSLVQSLGSTNSKAEKFALAKEIVDKAGKEKDGFDLGNGAMEPEKDLEKQAALAATFLDIVGVTAPGILFDNGKAGAQIIVSLGTSAAVYARLNQLSALNESQMASLKKLNQTLDQEVQALRSNKVSEQNCLAVSPKVARSPPSESDFGKMSKSQYNKQDAQLSAAVTAANKTWSSCIKANANCMNDCASLPGTAGAKCIGDCGNKCDAPLAVLNRAFKIWSDFEQSYRQAHK